MAITKKVDIHPQGKPITVLNNMIRSDIKGAVLTLEEIRNILIQKGAVREVLPDGSTIPLNLSNYKDMDLYREKRKEIARIVEAEKKASVEDRKRSDDIRKKDNARANAIAKLVQKSKSSEVKKDSNTYVEQAKLITKPITTAPLSTTPDGYREKYEARKSQNQKNKRSMADAVEAARAKIEANKKKNKK